MPPCRDGAICVTCLSGRLFIHSENETECSSAKSESVHTKKCTSALGNSFETIVKQDDVLHLDHICVCRMPWWTPCTAFTAWEWSRVEGRGKLCGQMPAVAAETAAKRGSNPPPSPRPSLDICLRNENEVAGGKRAPAVFSQVSSAIWGRTVQYVTQEAADGRNEYRQASAPPLASPLPIQSYLAQHPEFRGIIGRTGSFCRILPYVPCLT